MKTTILTTALLLLSLGLFAQVSINTDGSSPDTSALLDVKSTNKGMLIPRMTTTQRDAISLPATGLLVFDETTGGFWFYNGSIWEDLSAGDNLGDHTATQNINLNGNYLSGDGTNEGIFVDSDGKVGIGTTVPEYELDIGTDWRTHMLRLTSNGTTSSGDAGPIMEIDGGNGHWGTGSLTGLKIDLSGNSVNNRYAAIFNGGNVGIGTSTPSSKLSVSGSADFSGNVGIGTTTPTSALDVDGGNISLNGGWLSGDGGNEGLSVDANGNVSIGNSSPGGLLHVGSGSLSGNQNITIENNQNRWRTLVTSDGRFAIKEDNNHMGNTTRFIIDKYTGDVGIGNAIPNPDNPLHVGGFAGGDNSNPANYIVRIENKVNSSLGSQEGVLALLFDSDLNGNPGVGNWIQFFEGGTDLAGKIENNNNGNVQYESGGSDYAELLERLDHDEEINAGDIVGVFGGKISKNTEGADWVMAVSDQAIVLGNAIYDGTEENYEIVSFIGQIPVFVCGKVNIGDYILASGANDGTAIAVSPLDIEPEQGRLIVGRAWEAKETEEVARVNAVVGLPEAASTTMALARRVEAQQAEIDALKSQNESLQTKVDEMDVLKAENIEMKTDNEKQQAEIESIKAMLGMNNEIAPQKRDLTMFNKK